MTSQDPEGLFPCILGHEAAGYVLLKMDGFFVIVVLVFMIKLSLNVIDVESWRVSVKVSQKCNLEIMLFHATKQSAESANSASQGRQTSVEKYEQLLELVL